MTKEEVKKIKWLKQYHTLRERSADCEERIKELRDQLMHTTSTDEARQIIHQWHEAMSASE